MVMMKVKMKKTIVIMTLCILSVVLNGCGNDYPEKSMSVSEPQVENEEFFQIGESETDSAKNISEPGFRHLISDMDENYIYYIEEKGLGRISKNNFEKEHIFTGNNTILGISVYEGWIYFLEDTQGIGGLPYSLSKVNSSGERYTVISATDASFLDISEDILFLRTYTIEGMRDSLYTLSITGDSLVETIIDNHDITIRKNDILDSVISTNENKKIFWGEEILYQVENENDEVFIKNYNENHVVLELYKDGIEYQTLIMSLDEKRTVTLPDLRMQYVDLLEHWMVYIDDSNHEIYVKDLLEISAAPSKEDALTVYGSTSFELDETNSYNVLNQKTVENDFTKYGKMEMVHEEFQSADGSSTFYYDMECFYFDDSYPTVLNETLQAYYDAVEEGYRQDSQVYSEPFEGNVNTPYNSLIFQYFTYVDEDYVSLVYNNVCYMGGAHPYSAMDGITIDCTTGEIVAVQQFVDDSDEKIGEQLELVLGTDSTSMDEWDYYLTEDSVVFFYYDPRYWEPVATRRIR